MAQLRRDLKIQQKKKKANRLNTYFQNKRNKDHIEYELLLTKSVQVLKKKWYFNKTIKQPHQQTFKSSI